jgi:hypothetical protein
LDFGLTNRLRVQAMIFRVVTGQGFLTTLDGNRDLPGRATSRLHIFYQSKIENLKSKIVEELCIPS